jgi:catechol 2,3-dioxygenase-like lactoylglutathione lyase family enzyme
MATMMIPVTDMARAKAWYADKLGLMTTQDMADGTGAMIGLKGVRAMLYTTTFAGTAQNTMLGFDSPDLEADMAELRKKGVVFLDYDFPGLKTENGMATFGPVKNAWCNDSEGNILAFVEGM